MTKTTEKKKRKKHASLLIDSDLWSRIVLLAKREKRTISGQFEIMIEDHLDRVTEDEESRQQ